MICGAFAFFVVVNVAEIFVFSKRLKQGFKRMSPCGLIIYADNICLPFLRLLANTFLPPGVRIRLRKPCSRLRWRFFGWKVLFIGVTSLSEVNAGRFTPLLRNGFRRKAKIFLFIPLSLQMTLYAIK